MPQVSTLNKLKIALIVGNSMEIQKMKSLISSVVQTLCCSKWLIYLNSKCINHTHCIWQLRKLVPLVIPHIFVVPRYIASNVVLMHNRQYCV